jgi:hypothetical protein
MGTLGKDGSNPLIFDGRLESWPLLDNKGYGWVVEGGDVFFAMLLAASAKAAKSTVTSGKAQSQQMSRITRTRTSRRRSQTRR